MTSEGDAYTWTAHLFRRAGFGGLHSEVEAYRHLPWEALVDLVLDASNAPTPPPLPDLSDDRDYGTRWSEMVQYWLNLASRPVDQAPIVEKMTLFWSGTLCSSLDKTHTHLPIMQQNVLFRERGLGKYDRLLHETAKGAAMIEYLDNHRNVAGDPNENFARELMELFGTGPGHYTERDVAESARAWTGHGIDESHRYVFDPSRHDFSNKTFLGVTGKLDGPEIIDIMLTKRRSAHARFMCHRLWSFFAYPVDASSQVVTDIMVAYQPGLDIAAAVRAIFLHPKFRSEEALYALVRSPFEWVVAAMRHGRVAPKDVNAQWLLTSMGQAPFKPPDVSGWRQNEYWMTAGGAWAKGALANEIRWQAYGRDELVDAVEIVDWSPMTWRYSPRQSLNLALANYDLGSISKSSEAALLRYIQQERTSDAPWGERAGLLWLLLLLPELQMG